LSIDLQQKIWLSEVRTTFDGGSVVDCDKRCDSPAIQQFALGVQPIRPKYEAAPPFAVFEG
jgi:hypothetical protein